MKNLFMCILSLLSLFGCKGYEDLTVDEFEKMLAEDSNVQLVDVRTAEEYAAGHLPGAINIDWRGNDFLDKVNAFLSKDRPTMVYCRSGRRSAEAAALLDGIGIKTYNMLGGYLAWTAAGKLTTTSDSENCNNKPSDMNNEMKFCQSCGMPLTEEMLGTNADGSKNQDYCIYCYKDGQFTKDCTMDEMIEFCAQFVDEVNKNLPQPITKEEYIAQMKQYFPMLKRWNGK